MAKSFSYVVALLGFCSSLITAAQAAAPPTMMVPGQTNVSAAGAFTYSVPIVVPPGTAGMGPALALDYSSQNGDGPEGLGWALTGLPTVTRCPRTVAQDSGVHGSVNYDINDRFCMNGQRLVLVSGTYGMDGSEYRTEIDSYSRILAHGTAGNGPAWFEVHTKAGQILELGYITDSRILPVKADGSGTMPTARAWAVDKISDTKGNYLTVTYTNDTTNGQAYPIRVDYTGNVAAGLSTYNSVQFIYGPRSDIVPSYQAGGMMKTTVLLTDIKTYAGATLVTDYKLAYNYGSQGDQHDELSMVTQCDGSSPQNCLPGLSFGWQGSRDTLTYSIVPNGIGQATGNGSIVAGDFNGDGLTDALVLVPGATSGGYPCPLGQTAPFNLGTQSGTTFTPTSFPMTNYTTLPGNPPPTTAPFCPSLGGLGGGNAEAIDFTGAGLSDLALTETFSFGGGYSQMAPAINTGGAFNMYNALVPNGIIGDYNGDGRADILILSLSIPDYVWSSNGDGTFAGAAPTWTGNGGVVTVADLDGDGCTDLITVYLPSTMILDYSCHPAVSTYTTTAVQLPPIINNAWTWPDMPTGDFNGDGKADFLDFGGKLWLSTGTGLAAPGYVLPTGFGYVGDFNGDGKADIAILSADGLSFQIYLSTGTGFVLAATIPIPASDTGLIHPVVADWNNDGAQDIWLQKASGDEEILFHYTPELMNSVSNGLGASTNVTYGRLNDPTVYTKGSGAAYPIQDMIGAQYVVSKIQSSNGIGGQYETDYTYAGAKTDLSGRGFLGFSQVSVADPQLHVTQVTNYRMDFPFTGAVASQTKTYNPVGLPAVTLNAVTNSYKTDPACASATVSGPPYTVELCQSVAQSSDSDGTAFPSVTTNYTYDAYGNATTVAVAVSDGSSKTTTNTYTNDTTNWFLGRLTVSSVQSIVGSSNLTRVSTFGYDPSSGLVTSQIEPAEGGALNLETDIVYDSYGNKHVVTPTGEGATASGLVSQTRPTTTAYDSRGQFATTITNAAGESEQWAYSASFGAPTSHTGPNGLTTSWTIDSFGRPTKEVRPDGTETLYSYVYCAGVAGGSAACPTNGAYLVEATPLSPGGTSQSAPDTITYYDTLSRAIASDTQAFDTSASQWIRADTIYDSFGRVAKTDRPYFLSGGTQEWTVNSYINPADANHNVDPLAHLFTATAPDASVTSYTYDALNATVTNADNATTATQKNAQGLVALITDAKGQYTSYVYDAFGDVTKADPPGAQWIANSYDGRGRKLTSADPDMGGWSYTYDAFGELATQTDALGHVTTMGYDLLGRLTSRAEPDMASTWTYGNLQNQTQYPHSIDKLVVAACGAGASGNVCATGGYSRTYLYDSLGRPSRVTIAIGSSSWYTTTSYDGITGQKSSVRAFSGFTLNYFYTARGYLSSMVDATTLQTDWLADARDAELHLIQATAGNGVVTNQGYDPTTGRVVAISAGTNQSLANLSYDWDAVGNLLHRTDMLAVSGGETESFCYDALNRVVKIAMAGTCGTVATEAYNNAGSLTMKSDVCATTNCFVYGSTQPHALASITGGTVNGVANPTFTYDANGNMLTGAGRTVTYTSFNMASSIVEGSTSVTLTYDPEHQRIDQGVSLNGGATTTTAYLNDPDAGVLSENIHIPSVSNSYKTYLIADGKIVAQRTTVNGSSYVDMKYFILDHLGSIAAITDGNQYLQSGAANPAYGSVIQNSYYDAWGKERNADGSPDTTCSKPPQSLITRGYTGQEEMENVCLVNYNARIYDPTLGKFMTPDDVIPDAYNGQSYNRYTYVDDNPLSYDDPTGHDLGNVGNSWEPLASLNSNNDNGGCSTGCDGSQSSENSGDSSSNIVSHAEPTQLASTGPSGSGITNTEGSGTSSTSETVTVTPTVTGNSPTVVNGQSNAPMDSGPQAGAAAGIDRSNTAGAGQFSGGNADAEPDGQPIEVVPVTGVRDANGSYQTGGLPVDISPSEELGLSPESNLSGDTVLMAANNNDDGHTKNKRPSTEGKHEEGDARRQQDKGQEKGDSVRRPPRVRPPDTKGPWPPKTSPFIPLIGPATGGEILEIFEIGTVVL